MSNTERASKLRDPLRTIRWWVVRIMLYGSLAAIGALAVAIGQIAVDREPGVALMLAGSFVGLSLPMLLVLLAVLPSRETSALYLRSFRTDRDTLGIRTAIQSGLGPTFRLSGIRDPRRRRSPLDYLAFTIFVLRYSTPKFMNLEAEGDWKLRLCNSMADARCVFIDVTQMTPYLAAEIALAAHGAGLARILFVGDLSQDAEGWRTQVTQHIPVAARGGPVQVARWDRSGAEPRQFIEEVRAFSSRLPPGNCGMSSAAVELAESADPGEPVYLHGMQFMLSSVFVTLFATGSGFGIGCAMPSLGSIWRTAGYCAVFAVLIWLFLDYLVHSTIWQRATVGGVLALCLAWYGGLFWVFVARPVVAVRERARTTLDIARLRQVGVALSQHHDAYGTLPSSANGDSREALSWQAALLPFIEQGELFRQINRDVRWDAAANAPIFKTVIPQFQSVGIGRMTDENGLALSHHAGNSLVFAAPRGWRLQAFSDGTSQTFVVGDVEDRFRPWGDPQNHRDPANGVKQGPNSFGRAGSNGALLLMADGSVRFVSGIIDATVFQALGTPNGGEPVDESSLDSIGP